MTALLLRLYDHLHRHPRLRWTLLVLLLLFMGGSVATTSSRSHHNTAER